MTIKDINEINSRTHPNISIRYLKQNDQRKSDSDGELGSN